MLFGCGSPGRHRLVRWIEHAVPHDERDRAAHHVDRCRSDRHGTGGRGRSQTPCLPDSRGAAGIGLVGTSSPAAATEPTGTAGGTEGAVGAEGAAGGSVANRARTRRGNPVSTPPVAGVHLQFGADAAIEIVVSWHSLQPVSWPRVLLGSAAGRFQRVVDARTVSYTDAKSGRRPASPLPSTSGRRDVRWARCRVRSRGCRRRASTAGSARCGCCSPRSRTS